MLQETGMGNDFMHQDSEAQETDRLSSSDNALAHTHTQNKNKDQKKRMKRGNV